MTKPLIAINSPTYLRRLVREINLSKRTGLRLYATDAVTGTVRRLGRVSFNGTAVMSDKVWPVAAETIYDDNGASVCASRHP